MDVPTGKLYYPVIMAQVPKRTIPLYALYGEETAVEDREFVHIEDLASRGSLYDWEIKAHAHAGLFQILVLYKGSVRVSLDQDNRAVDGPAVITVPAGVVHGFQMTPGARGMVLSVAADFLDPRPGLPDRDVLADVLAHAGILDFSGSPGRFKGIQAAVTTLHQEFHWPQKGRAMMFDALLRGLVVLLRRKMAVPEAPDRRQGYRRTVFTRFRTLVDAHYRDHWPLGDYATAMHMSESKLNRVCEHFTGKTAFEVLQDRILLEAQRYLMYTTAPISQIAYDLGFSDPGYFCRYFKKRTGKSPRIFRLSRE